MRAPGPKGSLVGGSLGPYRADPLGSLSAWARAFGPVARFRLGPTTAHLLSTPELVAQLFNDRHGRYRKEGVVTERLRPLLGGGLLNSNGDHWRRQRRIMQPAFHREPIARFAEAIAAAGERMLARWEGQRAVDVAAEMMRVTLNIVGATLFSADLEGEAVEAGEAITEILRFTSARMVTLMDLPLALPVPAHRRYRRALAVVERMVRDLLAERRRAGGGPRDLLAMLIEARDAESGEAMSDEEVRDEVMTMLMAGHETTANALAWTLYLLARNPAAAALVRAEASALGDRAPTADDLPKLRYTQLALQESMRLYPPIWATARVAAEDDSFGGFDVPRGSLLFVSPWVMHRSPSLWSDPERFDPERFTAERSDGRPKYAYFPFGGGQRICLGQHFAMLEATLLIALIARRFSLALPTHAALPEALVTLRPRGGLPMAISRR